MRTGGIPKKIALYLREPQSFAAHNPWMKQIQRGETQNLSVTPAMPTDAESDAQRATAQDWSSDRGTKPTMVQERDNTPFKLRIIGVEARGEGGRAWKVLTDDGLLLDMREEILLECVTVCGIAAGGTPNGEFIFAREGSQMKIIRIGSDIHTEFTAAESRRTAKSLKTSDLKPGVFYRGRGNNSIIYFGRISKGGQHLWLKIPKHALERQTPADMLAYTLRTGHGNSGQWQTTDNVSVVEAVEELSLPADYASIMRKAAKATVARYLDPAVYGRPTTQAQAGANARGWLRQYELILNFDPSAEPGTQSQEMKSILSAIALAELSTQTQA